MPIRKQGRPTIDQTGSDTRSLRVLHVEDDPVDARLLQMVLSRIRLYRVDYRHVSRMSDAERALQQASYDLVLLDLHLADGRGFDLVKTVNTVAPDVPVVILSASEDEELTLEAIRHGAQEYLIKGQVNRNMLLRAIRYAIDRKRMETQLKHLSHHDQLTGLANRYLFKDRLQQALARSRRQKTPVALLFVDLDYFKSINDRYGHEAGDTLLKQAAGRLKSCVRQDDTVARLGGDEFVIILENIQGDEAVSAVAEKILGVTSEVYVLDHNDVYLTASLGISIYHGDEDIDLERLMKHSDLAMYQAKREGRNEFRYFADSMKTAAKTCGFTEGEVWQALEKGEFLLSFQPQFSLEEGRPVGAEALLRWRHPRLGLLYPGQFLNILKEGYAGFEINEWVLRTACSQWKQWIEGGLVSPGTSVSVNICARQFGQKDLVRLVEDILMQTGLGCRNLELEITEMVLLNNSRKNLRTLNELGQLGVKLSLDDFGTGFSSMNYLKHFNVDQIKVDRSFVKDILTSEPDYAIATSIITLANHLGVEVISEGVDSKEKIDLLSRRGCRLFQGFYYAPPLFPDEFISHPRMRATD